MNSIKNLVVVVLLLGVSYGAFQVINAPDPTFDDGGEEELDITIGEQVDPGALSLAPVGGDTATPSDDRPDMAAEVGANVAADVAAPPLQPIQPEVPQTAESSPEPSSGVAQNTTAPPTSPLRPNPPSHYDQQADDSNTFDPQPQTSLEVISPPADSAVADTSQLTTPPALEKSPAQFDAVPNFEGSGQATINIDVEAMDKPIDWMQIERLVNNGQFTQALEELSQSYNSKLAAEQRRRMLEWLDALAGKVIYSTEHHLQPRPYVVQNGDSLEMLAASWQVPAELIYNVNRAKIADKNHLMEGTELKQLSGPFFAQVSTDRNELTIFLNGLYAGRFAISFEAGQAIDHGVVPYEKARTQMRLSSRDATDVNSILSDQSQVRIMR